MLKHTLKVHRLVLTLHHHRIKAIATVLKLDNLIVTITHSAIIVLNEIFQ